LDGPNPNNKIHYSISPTDKGGVDDKSALEDGELVFI